MKILISGIGGVGGYFGSKMLMNLSREHQIYFYATEKTTKIIAQNGLKIKTKQETCTVHPNKVSSNVKDFGLVDLIIFAVKSYHLSQNLEELREIVDDNTIFLSLLNGIDNEEKIREKYPQNLIWNGFAFIFAKKLERGIIQESGESAKLFFGSEEKDSRLKVFDSIIQKSEIVGGYLETIRHAQWKKFFFISTVATFTSYYDCNLGEIQSNIEYYDKFKSLVDEFVLYANDKISLEKGILLQQKDKDEVFVTLERQNPESTSSMQRDFREKNQTEVDTLTGVIAKSQLDLPIYQTMYESLKNQTK